MICIRPKWCQKFADNVPDRCLFTALSIMVTTTTDSLWVAELRIGIIKFENRTGAHYLSTYYSFVQTVASFLFGKDDGKLLWRFGDTKREVGERPI